MILSFITEEITGMLETATVKRLNSKIKSDLFEQENPRIIDTSADLTIKDSSKPNGLMNDNSLNPDNPAGEVISENTISGPVFKQNSDNAESIKEISVNGDSSFEKKYKLLLEQMQKERIDRELLLNKYNDLIFKRSDN